MKMPGKETSQLVEQISQETLKTNLTYLRRIVQRSHTPSFIMGYCAAKPDTFNKVFNYLQDTFAIKNPLEVILNPNQRNLREYFLKHLEDLKSFKGGLGLVKALGFERLSALNYGISYRIGHDYDQDVCENQKKTFKGLDKKIIVVTQINPSTVGEEDYNRAVVSASQSQFKSFLYEFHE